MALRLEEIDHEWVWFDDGKPTASQKACIAVRNIVRLWKARDESAKNKVVRDAKGRI